MKLIQIRKKSGKMRTICVPDEPTKTRLRAMCGRLAEKALRASPDPALLHGFVAGRSPVTCASAHIGHRYTICMDLEDFFDSVTAPRVAGKLSALEIEACLIDPADGRGARALQGLPTSPAIANLAAADMDRAILRSLKKHAKQVVYTRYADDLTFSYDAAEIRPWLLAEIPAIVARCGFRVAPRKTRYMPASAGLRHIVGVAVGPDGIHPTRAAKRKARAALHQARIATTDAARVTAGRRARGLAEWCALRQPRPPRPVDQPDMQTVERSIAWIDTARRLADHWSLGRLPPLPTPAQAETQEGDYLITHDPAYILGMSTYTTGWTSCMGQPNGAYRRGAKVWVGLAGTSVAALLSDRTATHAGVERRVMRARCLLHRMRDGKLGYDRIYGDAESGRALSDWLERRGAVAVKTLRRCRVIGNVPRSNAGSRPYCDSLSVYRAVDDGRNVWTLGRG